MSDVYIMRVNWSNYNSAWHEGKAFSSMSSAKNAALENLERNFKSENHETGEMVFKEYSDHDRADIAVYLRHVGKDDVWLGHAEIYRVPAVESGNDADND